MSTAPRRDTGEKIVQDVKILTKLGEGANCQAFLVEYCGKKACLKLGERLESLKGFVKEASFHEALQGAGEAPLVYAVATDRPLILMELCDGKSLRDVRDDLSLDDAKFLDIFVAIALRFEEIHQCGVTHNDFKGDNVIITNITEDPKVSLIDFGLATWVGGCIKFQNTDNYETTPQYAPEVFYGEAISPAGDVYSLGRAIEQLFNRRVQMGLSSAWPRGLEELCQWMTEAAQEDRPYMIDVIQVLQTILSLMKSE